MIFVDAPIFGAHGLYFGAGFVTGRIPAQLFSTTIFITGYANYLWLAT